MRQNSPGKQAGEVWSRSLCPAQASVLARKQGQVRDGKSPGEAQAQRGLVVWYRPGCSMSSVVETLELVGVEGGGGGVCGSPFLVLEEAVAQNGDYHHGCRYPGALQWLPSTEPA